MGCAEGMTTTGSSKTQQQLVVLTEYGMTIYELWAQWMKHKYVKNFGLNQIHPKGTYMEENPKIAQSHWSMYGMQPWCTITLRGEERMSDNPQKHWHPTSYPLGFGRRRFLIKMNLLIWRIQWRRLPTLVEDRSQTLWGSDERKTMWDEWLCISW